MIKIKETFYFKNTEGIYEELCTCEHGLMHMDTGEILDESYFKNTRFVNPNINLELILKDICEILKVIVNNKQAFEHNVWIYGNHVQHIGFDYSCPYHDSPDTKIMFEVTTSNERYIIL